MYQFFVATSVMPHQTGRGSIAARDRSQGRARRDRSQKTPTSESRRWSLRTLPSGDGHVTRLSSLRTSLRNSRARSKRPPAASLTASNRPGSSATFALTFDDYLFPPLAPAPACPPTRRVRAGRPGGNRTPNPRFWRPVLCQLSYWPWPWAARGLPTTASLRFLVSRVLPAIPAELAHLETLGCLLPILRRAVVAALAVAARHRDDVSHFRLSRGPSTAATRRSP